MKDKKNDKDRKFDKMIEIDTKPNMAIKKTMIWTKRRTKDNVVIVKRKKKTKIINVQDKKSTKNKNKTEIVLALLTKTMGMNKNMKRNKRKSIKSSMIGQDKEIEKDIQTRDSIKDKEEIDNTIDGND